jgi:O-antigen/teichoic acid export membrane protein
MIFTSIKRLPTAMAHPIHTVRNVINDALYRNTVYLFASTIVLSGSSFVFWLIVAHHYSVQEVGLATALVSVTNLIVNLSLVGVENAVVRYLPKEEYRSSLVSTGITVVLAISILLSILYIALAHFISPTLSPISRHAIMAIPFVLLTGFCAINVVLDGVFVAYRRGDLVFLKTSLLAIARITLPFAMVAGGFIGIYILYSSAALVAVVAFLFVVAYMLRLRLRLAIDRRVIAEIRRYALGNYISGLFSNLTILILPLITLHRLGPRYTAFLYMAFMMANLLFLVATAAAQSLLAEGAYQEDKMPTFVRKSFRIAGAMLLPMMVIVMLGGGALLDAFGRQFDVQGIALLRILALSSVPVLIGYVYMTILRIRHRINAIVVINVFGAVAILIVSWIAAPNGLAAVGWVWLAGQTAIAGTFYAAFRRLA